MYSDEDLSAAVSAGIMPGATAEAFRAFVAEKRAASVADEEHFRLLTGFNDIFVGIAVAITLLALGWLSARAYAPAGGAAVAVASWLMAEFFTAKRRMALPSILLLGGFVGGVFWSGTLLAPALGGNLPRDAATALAAFAAAVAAYLHWRRFHVPITVAAGMLALCILLLSLLFLWQPRLWTDWFAPLLLIAGLAVFMVAMAWDMQDRERKTRRSDVAFWLHITASPLIVHSLFSLIGVFGAASIGPAKAALIFGLYLLLAILALIIDRRAMLVSALAYVVYALSTLFKEYGAFDSSLALTALFVGSGLLLLSALWHRARALALAPLPAALRGRLPAG